jgi:hypothetical protein
MEAAVENVNTWGAQVEQALGAYIADPPAGQDEEETASLVTFCEKLGDFLTAYMESRGMGQVEAIAAAASDLHKFVGQLARAAPPLLKTAVAKTAFNNHLGQLKTALRNLVSMGPPPRPGAGVAGGGGAVSVGPTLIDASQEPIREAGAHLELARAFLGKYDQPKFSVQLLLLVRLAVKDDSAYAVLATALPSRILDGVKQFIRLRYHDDSEMRKVLASIAAWAKQNPSKCLDLGDWFGHADGHANAVLKSMARYLWEEMAPVALYLTARQLQRTVHTLDAAVFVAMYLPFHLADDVAMNRRTAYATYNSNSEADQDLLRRQSLDAVERECRVCKEKGHVLTQCPQRVVEAIARGPGAAQSVLAGTPDGAAVNDAPAGAIGGRGASYGRGGGRGGGRGHGGRGYGGRGGFGGGAHKAAHPSAGKKQS